MYIPDIYYEKRKEFVTIVYICVRELSREKQNKNWVYQKTML